MAVFDDSGFDAHERVVFCHDASTGLSAIIAIHSTALGPAAGGTRLWSYGSDDEALHDVLRLVAGHELQERDGRSEIRRRQGELSSIRRSSRAPTLCTNATAILSNSSMAST